MNHVNPVGTRIDVLIPASWLHIIHILLLAKNYRPNPESMSCLTSSAEMTNTIPVTQEDLADFAVIRTKYWNASQAENAQVRIHEFLIGFVTT